MVNHALAKTLGGVVIGGLVCTFGLLWVVYPEKVFLLLRGWQFDDEPELSERGRLDQRGAGVMFVLMGLFIAYYSLP